MEYHTLAATDHISCTEHTLFKWTFSHWTRVTWFPLFFVFHLFWAFASCRGKL